MSFPKLSWGREKHDLADRWPKGPDGTPEKPAFLADSTEEDNAAGMTVEMLRAYGIPGSGKTAHLGLPQPCAHTAQDAPPGARRVDAQAVPPYTVGV